MQNIDNAPSSLNAVIVEHGGVMMISTDIEAVTENAP